MTLLRRVRSVLFAKGYSHFSLILGLITFILFAVLPWIRARHDAIVLMEHYADLGRTFSVISYMVRLGVLDAAAALTIALIFLPLAFLLAFVNRPVIAGLLFMASGFLLIYMFRIAEVSIYLPHLFLQWSGGSGLSPPYSIGPSPYAMMFMGIMFLVCHYYFRRKEPKKVI